MASFLKSIFRREEPDIHDLLSDLGNISEVTDYCLLDAEGKVVAMESKYGNDRALFSALGRDIARNALLVDFFARRQGGEADFCHISCTSGSILIWNFAGSFLVVLASGTKEIPLVRMTVNIFRNKALEKKQFSAYFQKPPLEAARMWEVDLELKECMESIYGTRQEEESDE